MVKVNEVSGAVGFEQAIKDFFKGYFDFKGKSTRAGFWFAVIFLAIIFVPVILLFRLVQSFLSGAIVLSSSIFYNPFFYLLFLCVLAFIFPLLAMLHRRMHDTGISLAWRNFILLLILFLIFGAFYGSWSPETWQAFAFFMLEFFLLIAVLIFSILPTNYFEL